MARLIANIAISVNGAFEAPSPAPNGWLVLDADSQQASLDMWRAADAMLIGRKTYEGLSTVWPQMADTPGFEDFAHQMNSMPKYVLSKTLDAPLSWNATLLKGDLTASVANLKRQHSGDLISVGAGTFVDELLQWGLVDELWLTVSPNLWGSSPRVFDHIGSLQLEFVSVTTFASGVVRLCYRPVLAQDEQTQ